MKIVEKIAFEKVLESMSHFLDFKEVEDEIENLIEEAASLSLLTSAKNDGRPKAEVLADYLASDSNEERIKLMVGMAGGSTERLKRIVAAMFDGASLSILGRDKAARQRIAKFMLDPEGEAIFIPKFVRAEFRLPYDWVDRIKDKSYLMNVHRDSLSSKYAARMGFQFETAIKDKVTELGYQCEKGEVLAVDNKEVDVAIPSVTEPRILIMVSYSLTTSSAQTSRANEQQRMYAKIRETRDGRAGTDLIFVNFVDGGGWISRQNDLRQLWKNCDYCFTYNLLEDFQYLLMELLNGA